MLPELSCATKADVYIAGGVESMTRAPLVMPKADGPYSRKTEIYDSTIGWRFTNHKAGGHLLSLFHGRNR